MIIEVVWKRDKTLVCHLDANAEIPTHGDFVHIYVNGTPKNLMVDTRTFFYDNENQIYKVQLICFDPTEACARF
jgi:hypothetical protein